MRESAVRLVAMCKHAWDRRVVFQFGGRALQSVLRARVGGDEQRKRLAAQLVDRVAEEDFCSGVGDLYDAAGPIASIGSGVMRTACNSTTV